MEPGDLFGRFVVDAVLGRGGATSVYRIRDPRSGEISALKVVKACERAAVLSLEQEGRVLLELHHANLVAAREILRHEGRVGVATEFVDGPTLRRWVEDVRPPLHVAIPVFHGIVLGLQEVHRAGFVHRDLKPDNILVSVDGRSPVAKIGDFGLVVAIGQRASEVVGTPQYMAPEQARPPVGADRRADLFSLGCVLYDMVCFRPAFVSPDPDDVQKLAAAGAYPDPGRVSPGLPPALVDLIDCLLQPDVGERADDCQAVLDLLDRPDLLQRLEYRPPALATTVVSGWEKPFGGPSMAGPGHGIQARSSSTGESWVLLALPLSVVICGVVAALVTAALAG